MTAARAPARVPALLAATVLLAGLGALALTSAGAGFIHTSAADVARAVLGRLTGNPEWFSGLDPSVPYAVVDVRLPRVATAAASGAALAVAGVLIQGVLLNPLAEPYTLGLSSGAAFGASLAIVLSLGGAQVFSVSAFAFAGAIATLFTVLGLASDRGHVGPTRLVLAGIVVSTILSAGIGFLKYVADENVARIIFWLMGSFGEARWGHGLLTLGAAAAALVAGLVHARDLNVLALGSRTATSLGVDASRVRLVLLTAASLATAACVSVSGIIAFVGLIVPHAVRLALGPDNARVLPVSALAGALLLLGADTVARAALPHEVPVGVLTALIGGPVFCLLFRARALGGGAGGGGDG